jgi:hypothetical protein
MPEITDNCADLLHSLVASYRSIEKTVRDQGDPVKSIERKCKEISEMLEQNSLRPIDCRNQYVIELPHEHEDYGVLVEGKGNFVAKCRYETKNNLPVDQGLREPMVALEAEMRDQDEFFAEIIGWDSENFNWTVMEKVEPKNLHWNETSSIDQRYREMGWNPKDPEYGENSEGKTVCFDYGSFFREDEWKVSIEMLQNSERAL